MITPPFATPMSASEAKNNDPKRGAPGARPPVSVIVPFAGTEAEASAMLERLATVRLAPGDEIVVVDNQPGGAVSGAAGSVRVIADDAQSSSYYARNRGVEESAGEWLHFIDSDCAPARDLIDAYFSRPLPASCGVVAGGVVSAPGQPELAARYARSRGQVSEGVHVSDVRPAGPTANLLVRREAWEQLGGFCEGVRSGADLEFCWRAQDLGWGFEHRPEASVQHVHPTELRVLLRKARRYGAGRRWVNRRYPGMAARQPLIRPLARCAVGVVAWTFALQPQRALFKLIDARWFLAMWRGHVLGDNRSPHRTIPQPAAGSTIAGVYPERGGLRAESPVEAAARPAHLDLDAARAVPVAYREDDPPPARARAFLALASRHPLRLLRALTERTGVWALAPAARRVAVRGGRLESLPAAEETAARVARLAGIPFDR